jgi:hypothetical protein
MPRPRKRHLFPLDARVLGLGDRLHQLGRREFYDLEVAKLLDLERSTVDKSLHGLVGSGWRSAGRSDAASTGSPRSGGSP